MNVIKVSKEQLQNILEDCEVIEREKHYRHNAEYMTILFKKDDKMYTLTYFQDSYDGIQWEEQYEATEVKPVEETVIRYKPV